MIVFYHVIQKMQVCTYLYHTTQKDTEEALIQSARADSERF